MNANPVGRTHGDDRTPGESRRFTLPIDPVHAQRYAYAGDDENPVYFSVDAARGAGYDRPIAPPMYVCSMFDHAAGPPERELRADGVAPQIFPGAVRPDAELMGGGQDVEFLAPVYQGATVEVVRTVVDHYRRQSRAHGTLDFVVIESQVLDSGGQLLVRIVDTLVAKQ